MAGLETHNTQGHSNNFKFKELFCYYFSFKYAWVYLAISFTGYSRLPRAFRALQPLASGSEGTFIL